MEMVPITVIVPTKNEILNIAACLGSVCGWAQRIIVVDSNSSDGTAELAKSLGAEVVQFAYAGGWPKKRQWVLDNYEFKSDWVFLLDADEVVPVALKREIASEISNPEYDGYYLRLRMNFLGRVLKFGDRSLYKLSLFRVGLGGFECRLEDQATNMCDMEVHEHVVVKGRTTRLTNYIEHNNVNTLERYIDKQNEYSNWEAKVIREGTETELRPDLFGTQAQRRRYLKRILIRSSLFPIIDFLYTFVLRLGFLDGRPGFIYSGLRAVQIFHVQSKLFERSRTQAVNERKGMA